MNFGIQAGIASNVSGVSATSGRGSPGGPGAETFLSTYAASLSKSSLAADRTSENGPTKGNAGAKTTSGTGGPTANPKAAPRKEAQTETLPANPATGGASVSVPIAQQVLPVPTALATLPDFSPASAVAAESAPAVSQAASSQTLTPQTLAALGPIAPALTASVTTATVSDDSGDGAQAQTQSSVTAFPVPVLPGLGAGIGAPDNPVQKSADGSAGSSAVTASPPPPPIDLPLQDSGTAPASGTFADAIVGAASESEAVTVSLSSAANLQSRRESLAVAKPVASGEAAKVHALQDSESGNSPAIGVSAAHGMESAFSKLQNGLATESLFQMHLAASNGSGVTSSSTSSLSTSSSLSTAPFSPAPAATGTPVAAANAGADSGRKQIAASAASDHSPSSITPATAAQGKDAESGDTAAGQSEEDQSFRKDLTNLATPPAPTQPLLPQLAVTSVAGGTAGQPVPSPAASRASKPDAAAAADSPSLTPASGESALAPAVGPVQMAQMVNRAAQSDMRIGLTTSAFGNVEVHTQIRANDVGLAIGSERGDLRSLLANELPNLANRLQEQSLRLSPVSFHESSASSGGSQSGGDSQRRFFAQPAPASSSTRETEISPATGTTESPRSRHAGLSVLA